MGDAMAFKNLIWCLVALMLLGCNASGPKKALDEMAKSLEDKNPQAFLAHFDMKTYANNELKNLTGSDETLSILNSLGETWGLGSLDGMLDNFIDMGRLVEQRYKRGVASGSLSVQCAKADTPDCPWVAASLRKAKIITIGKTGAIAEITTPVGITSWLAMREQSGKWVIVANTPLESIARKLAGEQKNGEMNLPDLWSDEKDKALNKTQAPI